MYDLSNGPEMIGTNAVPLALVAFLVVRIRLSIFREHFISQLFITLLAILTFGVLSIMMRVVVGGTLQGNSAWSHFVYVAGNGVYSCIVAPFANRHGACAQATSNLPSRSNASRSPLTT